MAGNRDGGASGNARPKTYRSTKTIGPLREGDVVTVVGSGGKSGEDMVVTRMDIDHKVVDGAVRDVPVPRTFRLTPLQAGTLEETTERGPRHEQGVEETTEEGSGDGGEP